MSDLRLSAQYARMINYGNINNSEWFKAIANKACQNSERCQNRLFIYFDSEEAGQEAMKECEKRNISCLGLLYNTLEKTYRLDVMMNWKENRPTRADRRKELVLG